MRYIELLLYLKLKQQRNGNKYLLLAAGGPVKSAASKSRESGEKAANEEWCWGQGWPQLGQAWKNWLCIVARSPRIRRHRCPARGDPGEPRTSSCSSGEGSSVKPELSPDNCSTDIANGNPSLPSIPKP